MKRGSLELLSASDLSAKCEEVATAYGKASDNGDYQVVNKQHDVLVTLWKELSRRGKAGREVLLALMNNPSPWVRLWAASCALWFTPEPAERVLSEIANGPPGICRLDAEMTLQEWRKGTLKMPE